MSKIDELDRKIIRRVCDGVYSYEELGEILNVARSTVYRRINRLEREGLLRKEIMAIPNFERLDYSSVVLGIDIGPEDKSKAIDVLKDLPRVKLLWSSYGTHEIVAVVICERRCVGECVDNIKKQLSEAGVEPTEVKVSVSISWEKLDLAPP